MPELAAPTTEGDSMTPFLLRLGAAGVAVLLAGAAQAQSCTTIGSSTFCGARGSHNTVGNTMIFNQGPAGQRVGGYRSEEHTSELQALMRISYAVFCLKKKKNNKR